MLRDEMIIHRAVLTSLTCTALSIGAFSCGDSMGPKTDSLLSFEEFLAHADREPDTGIYIVDGDMPARDLDALRAEYARAISGQALTVHHKNGAHVVWSGGQQLALTYCVSQTFNDYAAVVAALDEAAANWELIAQVDFVHLVAEDTSCTANNPNVIFDVRPVFGREYYALAFLPDAPRAERSILVNSSAFFALIPEWTLAGLMRHELGHVLGFRHEHLRTEAFASTLPDCGGPLDWWPVTEYDPGSVMHYPWCRGTNTGDLNLTVLDIVGVASIYGGKEYGGPHETWATSAYYGTRGTYFEDLDADGRADAIVVNNSGVTIRRSTGTSFGSYENWTTNPYYGAYGTHFADVTGDGRADAIVVNAGGITVRRSTGGFFSANETWTSNPYYGSVGTYFADVDGDGRADAIVVNAGGITVRRSTGSNFGTPSSWTSIGYFGDRGTYFADVDGDGRADVIALSEDATHVRRSTGTNFGASEVWTANGYFGDRDTWYKDADGDGRADAIAVDGTGIYLRRSTGSSFGAYELWTTAPFYGDLATVFADINGDDKADAVAVNSSGITVRRGIR